MAYDLCMEFFGNAFGQFAYIIMAVGSLHGLKMLAIHIFK